MSEFLSELSVTPFTDGRNWRINADLIYDSDIAGRITVPARFATDFASIPQALWAILPPWGTYGSASVVHDFLYWQHVDKAKADDVLREAMELLGVDDDVVTKIYGAVVMFGQGAWDKNAKLRANRYTRMASAGSQPPYAALPDLPEAL